MRTILLLSLLLVRQAVGQEADEYQILNPTKSSHLISSKHFVVRWNDADGVKLTDEQIQIGLKTLESAWNLYIDKIGFEKPYASTNVKYKVNVNLSDKGWAVGCGTGTCDPAMWLNYLAFQDSPTLAHEFTHTLQFASEGLRDSTYAGWFWECHAEWMAHQMFPSSVGCSQQLVNAPHIYYGSTRDRYGCWQFWEFIKDKFGYSAVNDVWAKSKKIGQPNYEDESPLAILSRNMNWSESQLNDEFGDFALHNVTWDYADGAVFRKEYGPYTDQVGPNRYRTSLLLPISGRPFTYVIPNYHSPQRFGYNLVKINLNSGAKILTVKFRGIVQSAPGVERFPGHLDTVPTVIPLPHSDWRWGLVTMGSKGVPDYSNLQSGANGTLSINVSNTQEVWLVVVATPTEYQKILWDQMYYTIYRYPWMVTISGGVPAGDGPVTAPVGRVGAAHPNGGGWVESTAHVDPTAYVGPEAQVLDDAQVLGFARIEDQAVVSGRAIVKNFSVVEGRALVTGDSLVANNVKISDEASILGGVIDENARVGAMTIVSGTSTHVHGRSVIRAIMNEIDGFDIGGTTQLLGDVELQTSVSKGVFYGLIDQETLRGDGSELTQPCPEVTVYPMPEVLKRL